MPRTINQAEWLKKYVNGMNSAGPAYTAGVNAVTQSPTAAAAAALPKALRNFTEAVNSGRMAAALQSVSTESWKQATISKGAPRLGSGAQAASNKVGAYISRVAPVMAQLQAAIAAMPSDTPADMEARQLAWSRGMRAFAGR